MRRWDARQLLLTLAGATALWAVVAGLCLCVGSTGTGWPDAFQFRERLPRVLQASLVGAGLAAAGVVYQAILRNPLAEPYLLGVSTGAALAAYLWQMPALTPLVLALGAAGQAVSQQAFAFAGALVTVGTVFLLATRRGRLEPITLILVGVILNVMLGAVFLLVDALVRGLGQSGSLANFLIGGIQSNITASQFLAAALCIGAGWIVLLYVAGRLNAAMLSDAEALTLGVRVHRLRWVGLIVASLVTASAVAISGPIGFVGLICPHLARLLVGNDQRRLLPLATGVGAATLAMADAGTRLLLGLRQVETLLPVGVITGLLGGPFFLFVLYRSRRKSSLGEGA